MSEALNYIIDTSDIELSFDTAADNTSDTAQETLLGSDLNIKEGIEHISITDDTRQQDLTLELLPHQIELMNDTSSKILGISAGYGSGKTFIVARKTLQLAALNPGTDIIVCEPNFPLLVQILLPELHAALREAGLAYTYKATEQTFYVALAKTDPNTGEEKIVENRLICKSLENYDRLIGINASAVILDEFDTAKPELAYKAFLKLLGRLRAGSVRQLIIVSTPEGYGAMYRIFIKEQKGRLLKAKTTDNVFLPDDFIQTLYDIYPDNLVQSYINGEFVNLKTAAVFSHFNRLQHDTQQTVTQDTTDIWLGGDFNAGGSVTLIGLLTTEEDKEILHIVDELLTEDTFETKDILSRRYRNKRLYGSFDATGSKKTTNASRSDLDILADAGVSLMMGESNPHVMDSILSVNSAFKRGELRINTNRCPELTNALEQLAYDEVTGKPEKFGGPGTIDDYTDALRYLVWALKPLTKVTFSNFNTFGRIKKH
jgi:hypothetical protein